MQQEIETAAIQVVPLGVYCYSAMRVEADGVVKTQVCPYWRGTKDGARCELLREDSKNGDPFHLVWDQVKECSINRD